MIETYGKVTALDGTEFHYTDFRASRKEAVVKAESRDRTVIIAREEQKGRPLTIRESLEPVTHEERPPCEPVADVVTKTKESPPDKAAGIKLPYPLTAPARALSAAEESAKKMFAEMHLAAALAQQAKKAQPPSIQ